VKTDVFLARNPQNSRKRPLASGFASVFSVFSVCVILSSACSARADDRSDKADEHLKAGVARLEAHDPRGALKDLVLAVEYGPGNAEAHYALGMAYYQLDEHAKAQRALEAAVEKNPKHAGALEHLGRVFYAENRMGDAREKLRAALDVEPERASAKELLEKLDREAPVEEKYGERFTQHFRMKLENGGIGDGAIADQIGQALERAYSDVGYRLGHYPSRPIAVILYGDRDFYSVTGSHGWVAGLFDGKIRIPIKDGSKANPAALDRIVTHEYVHACLFTLAPRGPRGATSGIAVRG
jgi:tetratricopeptide (TPR) repeat protein